MSDQQSATPEASAKEVAPAVVQAPATPTVPVETQKAVEPQAPVAPVVPAAKPEQLLEVPSIPKPTVEALKLPENLLVPKERIVAIVSQSKTLEEAQSRVEFAQGLYADGQKAMEVQNQTRLTELKGDPELGGQKWEETKALYQAGMRRLFGEDAIKDVIAAKLDSLPWLVRGIVRAERAATAKPIVNAQPEVVKPDSDLQPHERIYGRDATYNPLNPKVPLEKPRSAPRF
jgi:hypothetical protein